MKGLVSGLLIGFGIGWLTAPMQGQKLRSYLAKNEWMQQCAKLVSASLVPARQTIGELGQVAINKVTQDYGSTLSDLAELVVNKGMTNGNIIHNLTELVNSLGK